MIQPYREGEPVRCEGWEPACPRLDEEVLARRNALPAWVWVAGLLILASGIAWAGWSDYCDQRAKAHLENLGALTGSYPGLAVPEGPAEPGTSCFLWSGGTASFVPCDRPQPILPPADIGPKPTSAPWSGLQCWTDAVTGGFQCWRAGDEKPVVVFAPEGEKP